MKRFWLAASATLLLAAAGRSQPLPSPGGVRTTGASVAPDISPTRPLPRRTGPRVRKRDNFFGVPLLALAFAGAGGAAAAAASGGGGAASPS